MRSHETASQVAILARAAAPGLWVTHYFVCEAVAHCSSFRGRVLAGGFIDRHEAQVALEALAKHHERTYLVPIRVIATDDEGPGRVRPVTFGEARALHITAELRP